MKKIQNLPNLEIWSLCAETAITATFFHEEYSELRCIPIVSQCVEWQANFLLLFICGGMKKNNITAPVYFGMRPHACRHMYCSIKRAFGGLLPDGSRINPVGGNGVHNQNWAACLSSKKGLAFRHRGEVTGRAKRECRGGAYF